MVLFSEILEKPIRKRDYLLKNELQFSFFMHFTLNIYFRDELEIKMNTKILLSTMEKKFTVLVFIRRESILSSGLKHESTSYLNTDTDELCIYILNLVSEVFVHHCMALGFQVAG